MATTTLSGTVTAGITYRHKSTDDIGDTPDNQTIQNATDYTNGRGDNQVDVVYRNQVAVTAGSPNSDFDLRGTLEDIFGNTLNYEYVKAIIIRNRSTTEGDDIYVGPLGVSNPLLGPWVDADGRNRIKAGGALVLDAPLDGYGVETTEQNIRVQYQGTSGTINVQICILGCSGTLESSSSSSSSLSSSSSSSTSSASSASSSSSVVYSSSSSSSSVVYSSSSSSSFSSSSQSSTSSEVEAGQSSSSSELQSSSSSEEVSSSSSLAESSSSSSVSSQG